MKKIAFLVTIGITLVFLNCTFPMGECEKEEGEIVRKEVKIENFNKLKLVGSSTVYISQGANQKVEIETTENIMEILDKSVEKEEWTIRFKKCIKTKKGVKFYITAPNYESIAINGSGDIISKSLIESKNINISLKGSGDIKLELETGNLDVNLKGSGDIKLYGKCESQELTLQGSGDYEAKNLKSQNAIVSVIGSGDAVVLVKKSLNAKVTGSGDITYYGNPDTKETNVTGSGDISAR